MSEPGHNHFNLRGLVAGLTVSLLVLLLWRPQVMPSDVLSGVLPEPGEVGAGLEAGTLAVVAALTVLMAIWWMTEALPIPVTSLAPMVLLPLLAGDRFSMAQVTANYGNWRIYLFLGGFLMAIAMESCNLHRRLALRTIALIGAKPKRLIFGFMVSTAFLSMWISNTATALMMLPIGMAVVHHFGSRLRFATALMLGIAYSASIGGVATPIGTPPNISMQGIYGSLFPSAPPIAFATWLAFGLPLVLLMLPVAWLVLTFTMKPTDGDAEEVLAAELAKLGDMSGAERRVLVMFVSTAMLWIFRRPIDLQLFVIPGWSEMLPEAAARGINDGVVAMAMGLLLFVLPAGKAEPPDGSRSESSGSRTPSQPRAAGRGSPRQSPRLLDWELVQEKMPWGILLLFGGGFALADAISRSGLSSWVGSSFGFLAGAHPLWLIGGAATILTFLTEVTSNTATAEVMLPIVAGISTRAANLNPLVLMLPVTIASSFAFMLPVATPPNAVIFGSRVVRMRDMMRYGLVLNLCGIVVLTLLCYFLAPALFNIDLSGGVPAWAR